MNDIDKQGSVSDATPPASPSAFPRTGSGAGVPEPTASGLSLAECVRSATTAPSLHNSQPWLFKMGDGSIDVYADRRRQLDVLDPVGRELLISVGAAVFTLRLALRGAGRLSDLHLFPDADDPDLAARVIVGRPAVPTPEVTALAAAIANRHTNRWPFARAVVPADVLAQLTKAARLEGATLTVANAVSRNMILGLSQAADRRLRSSGGYRAELARWTVPHAGRRDGVPPTAIGPWDALESLPIRDFGLLQPQLDRVTEQFEPYPTIVVLATPGDTERHWLQAGQALQCVLLKATSLHLSTTPISQPIEIPAIRQLLTDTGAGGRAQMIIRVGYGRPATATPRRPLGEVLLS